VYQPKQFSWTFLIEDQTPKENKSWAQARVIARDVMIGNVDDPTQGATFYHATYVNPSWADQMEVSKIIDKHVFYTWDGVWDE
jgi:spore germination cell wall hydrolase CwlJ-like protein